MKKDAKYYLGQNYSVEEKSLQVLDTYREILKINEGFVKVQTTSDVKLPENLKSVDETNMKKIIDGIEKVIENGKLHELFAYAVKVL